MFKFKLEFSKILALIVSFLYIYIIFFSSGSYFLGKGIPTELLSNVQVTFMFVLGGYITKAGIENVNKINKTE